MRLTQGLRVIPSFPQDFVDCGMQGHLASASNKPRLEVACRQKPVTKMGISMCPRWWVVEKGRVGSPICELYSQDWSVFKQHMLFPRSPSSARRQVSQHLTDAGNMCQRVALWVWDGAGDTAAWVCPGLAASPAL